MRVCKICLKEQHKNYYHNNGGKQKKKLYLQSEKGIASRKKYTNSEKGRVKNRKNQLKKKYSMSEDDYNTLLKLQNKKCKICKKDPEPIKLDVDHDHITGKIRGLLCGTCNRGLGNFKDNIDLMKAAIKYLEKYAS